MADIAGKKGWICIIWLSKEGARAGLAHTWICPCRSSELCFSSQSRLLFVSNAVILALNFSHLGTKFVSLKKQNILILGGTVVCCSVFWVVQIVLSGKTLGRAEVTEPPGIIQFIYKMVTLESPLPKVTPVWKAEHFCTSLIFTFFACVHFL